MLLFFQYNNHKQFCFCFILSPVKIELKENRKTWEKNDLRRSKSLSNKIYFLFYYFTTQITKNIRNLLKIQQINN